jgi:hypothetical protein
VAKYEGVDPNAKRETVRKIMNSLRTNYRKDKIKVENSEKSGCALKIFKSLSSSQNAQWQKVFG